MANIDIDVANVLNGEVFEVSLPDDQRVEDLLLVLSQRMEAGDPPTGAVWVLTNKTQQFEYAPDDTLSSANTNPRDSLALSTIAAPGR